MSTFPPESPRKKPTLLTLPAEIRLRVYAFLIPTPLFSIDLCTRRRRPSSADDARPGGPPARKSIASLLLQRTHDYHDLITNQNGLQLLFVCRLFANEVYPLLMGTTVRFCCTKHFVEVVKTFQYGVGEGRRWMRSVQVVCDLGEESRRQTNGWGSQEVERPRTVVAGRLKECRRMVLGWYGRLDLMGRERWWVEPVRTENGDGGEEEVDGKSLGENTGGADAGRARLQSQQKPAGSVFMKPDGTLGWVKGREDTDNVDKWIISGQFDLD
jgi:hypothetical protein